MASNRKTLFCRALSLDVEKRGYALISGKDAKDKLTKVCIYTVKTK